MIRCGMARHGKASIAWLAPQIGKNFGLQLSAMGIQKVFEYASSDPSLRSSDDSLTQVKYDIVADSVVFSTVTATVLIALYVPLKYMPRPVGRIVLVVALLIP